MSDSVLCYSSYPSFYLCKSSEINVWCVYYRPQRSCGKVMFLHLCVILFTGAVSATPPGQTPPWADTIPLGRHLPVDTTQQTPPALVNFPTFLFQAGIRSTSGWYASYWNAFFFSGKMFCMEGTNVQ